MWALVDLRLGYTETPTNIPLWDRDLLVWACRNGSPNTFAFREALQNWAANNKEQWDTETMSPLYVQYNFLLGGLRDIALQHYGKQTSVASNDRKAFAKLRVDLLKKRQLLRLAATQLGPLTIQTRFEILFLQWRNLSVLEPLQRQLKMLEKLDEQTKLRICEHELWDAWNRRSSFEMWNGINAIVNTVRSSRSHAKSSAPRHNPTQQDWTSHNALPGRLGGNAARPIDPLVVERCEPTHIVAPTVENIHRARTLVDMMVKKFNTISKRKAVDPDDVPPEVWLIALGPEPKDTMPQIGQVPHAKIGIAGSQYREMVTQFVASMLANAHPPYNLICACAWMLGKANGKAGCAAWRLIHGIPSLGRSFFFLTMSHPTTGGPPLGFWVHTGAFEGGGDYGTANFVTQIESCRLLHIN